jgi:hypothetical protein
VGCWWGELSTIQTSVREAWQRWQWLLLLLSPGHRQKRPSLQRLLLPLLRAG